MPSFDWRIQHSYTTDELVLDNEFGILKSFGYRVYSGSDYVELHFARSGTDFDDGQLVRMFMLPNHVLLYKDRVLVGGSEYWDIKMAVVWSKGRGVKARLIGSGVTVSIRITSSTTITQQDTDLFVAGNLYIRVLSGTPSLSDNTLTIEGSDVHISIGIGSELSVEDNLFGISNENMSLTGTEVSSGIKLRFFCESETFGVGFEEAVYLRWDELGRVYDIYETGHGYGGFVIDADGVQIHYMETDGSTLQVGKPNYIRFGIYPGYGHRTTVYLDADSVVNETYQPVAVPSRLVWLFDGDIVGWVLEGSIYRATGDHIADVVYARTIDLAEKKVIFTRKFVAVASFTVYQQGGTTVSFAVEGHEGGMPSDVEWGYKYYDGSWHEYTSLPSGYNYDNAFAIEGKVLKSSRSIDRSFIVNIKSVVTNRTVTYKGALAGNREMYLYPQLDAESMSSGDYLKEIAVAWFGTASEYGSTLEGRAELTTTLQEIDFDKTVTDPEQVSGFWDKPVIVYIPESDSYALSTEQPRFAITGYPSSVSTSPGATFTINVTVANNGSADGTAEVRIRDHNGNIVASKQVAVAAGSSTSVSLTATAPSLTGSYTWRVEAYNVDAGGVDDSKDFTVEVVGAAPIPMDTFWYLLIAVVLIAMLLLLIALALRRS